MTKTLLFALGAGLLFAGCVDSASDAEPETAAASEAASASLTDHGSGYKPVERCDEYSDDDCGDGGGDPDPAPTCPATVTNYSYGSWITCGTVSIGCTVWVSNFVHSDCTTSTQSTDNCKCPLQSA